MRNFRTFIASALMLAVLPLPCPRHAQAAEIVVMEVRGAALKPGQVLDDGKVLDLKDGQRVVLVTADGDTLKLKGPYHQRPVEGANSGNSLTVALAELVVQKGVRTSDVGVVRAATKVQLPEPWVVDVSHPGNRCIIEGKPIVFWRETHNSAIKFSVSPLNRGWHLSTNWPQGEDRLDSDRLGTELPVPGRATFLVDLGDGPMAITLISLPATLANDRMRVAWMYQKGCNLQAEALARNF